MRDQIQDAREALERACPLMELLPSSFHEGKQYTAACYAVLREIYLNLYSGEKARITDSKNMYRTDQKSIQKKCDENSDTCKSSEETSTSPKIKILNKLEKIWNSKSLSSSKSENKAKKSSTAYQKIDISKDTNADSENYDGEIDIEEEDLVDNLISDIRAPYDHIRSRISKDDLNKDYISYEYDNDNDDEQDSDSSFPFSRRIHLNSELHSEKYQNSFHYDVLSLAPEILRNFKASSETVMAMLSPKSFRQFSGDHYKLGQSISLDQIDESDEELTDDLLNVIETTTGITRDLEILLRRFVLDDSKGRRKVLTRVKKYRDELKRVLDSSSQVGTVICDIVK